MPPKGNGTMPCTRETYWLQLRALAAEIWIERCRCSMSPKSHDRDKVPSSTAASFNVGKMCPRCLLMLQFCCSPDFHIQTCDSVSRIEREGLHSLFQPSATKWTAIRMIALRDCASCSYKWSIDLSIGQEVAIA